MSEDLGLLLKASAKEASAKAAHPDLSKVLRGGRRRMWYRRAGAIVGIGSLFAALWVLIPYAEITSERGANSTSGGPASVELNVPDSLTGRLLLQADIPSERVVTFSMRAVAAARLTDPIGYRLEYRSLSETESGWLVNFASSVCLTDETCEEDGSAQMLVKTFDRSFAIERVDAPGAEADGLEKLANYREPTFSEETGLEFLAPVLVDTPDEAASVATSELWTGALPSQSLRMSVTCHLELRDVGGDLIYSGGPFEKLAPTDEAARTDDGIHMFGAPERLAGKAVSADVPCGTIHDVNDAPKESRKTWGVPPW